MSGGQVAVGLVSSIYTADSNRPEVTYFTTLVAPSNSPQGITTVSGSVPSGSILTLPGLITQTTSSTSASPPLTSLSSSSPPPSSYSSSSFSSFSTSTSTQAPLPPLASPGLSKPIQVGLGVGITLGALAFMLLGGGLMYYLLRVRGQDRHGAGRGNNRLGIAGEDNPYGIDINPNDDLAENTAIQRNLSRRELDGVQRERSRKELDGEHWKRELPAPSESNAGGGGSGVVEIG